MTLEDILARLSRPDVAIDKLLEECRERVPELLEAHPQLYEAFTERLIQQGHPGRALDLAREGQAHLQNNHRLQYNLALAAARGGNPHYAEALLTSLLALALAPTPPADWTTKFRVDVIALKGRVLKDRARYDPELITESAIWYERAAELPGVSDLPDAGTYPLINAATMWRLAHDVPRAEALASEVVNRLTVRAEQFGDDVWQNATLGEAYLLLGRHTESIRWYQRSVAGAVAKGRVGDLTAIRANYQRLRDAGITSDPAFLDEQLGSVVVFSGHMIDSPDRLASGQPARFPQSEALITAVKTAIAAELQKLNAKVGFVSLACGGDILFAEAMLDRNAELHIVLPFALQDFRRTSVDFGQDGPAWRRWQRRCDELLERIPAWNIHYSTTEHYLGSDGLFDFANAHLQGLAVLRARERVTVPKALVLIDRSMPGRAGGTEAFVNIWRKAGYPAHEIELAALRRTHAANFVDPREPVAPPPQVGVLDRPIRAMLFADVAGYSNIPEWQLSKFLKEYSTYLGSLFDSPIGKEVEYANTWGDGLFVVFGSVAAAAEFAMELVDPTSVNLPNWPFFGLGQSNPFRVGLHAGPVFELPNLFQNRAEYSGQHVNRAARIEPVTVRGCVYTSEPFAALLTMAGTKQFLTESVGIHALAKGYARCPLYRVIRA